MVTIPKEVPFTASILWPAVCVSNVSCSNPIPYTVVLQLYFVFAALVQFPFENHAWTFLQLGIVLQMRIPLGKEMRIPFVLVLPWCFLKSVSTASPLPPVGIFSLWLLCPNPYCFKPSFRSLLAFSGKQSQIHQPFLSHVSHLWHDSGKTFLHLASSPRRSHPL